MSKTIVIFSLLLAGCMRECPVIDDKDSGLLTTTYKAQIEDRETEVRNLTKQVERLSKEIEYWQSVGDEWRDKYFSQSQSSIQTD